MMGGLCSNGAAGGKWRAEGRAVRATRSGQVQQVFGIIFVAIVIISILYLGLKFIGILTTKGCDAQQQRFVEDFRMALETYDTWGTRQDITFKAPCGAEKLCLIGQEVDGNKTRSGPDHIPVAIKNQLASAADMPNTPVPHENVFLVKDNTIEGIAAEQKVAIGETYEVSSSRKPLPVYCFNATGGFFRMRVEGKTSSVVFSVPR